MEERPVVGWRCVGVMVMRVLMIGWGSVLRIERGRRGVGRAVLPVQMGVHGGESESRQHPDDFLSQLDVYFLELQHGVQTK